MFSFFLGVRTESSARHKGMEGFETEGVRGLKALGVRELSYKTSFLATTVVPTDYRVIFFLFTFVQFY